MRIRNAVHEKITKICVPLTERTFNAHIEDLKQWADGTKDQKVQKEYQGRIIRMTRLFRRVSLKNTSENQKTI